MTEPPYEPRRDRGEDVTRVSRYERGGPPPGPPSDGGRAWMLATVGLVALLLGVGVGVLVKDGGKTTTEVRTVRSVERTVTVPTEKTTTVAVTVTQPRTVVRTATVPVTVTATPGAATTAP
jgi:hypothetical protein